ncbi:hypothetical protein BS78_06G043400 [Paspalum vaginatum]|nr:hypothetical protein BS78_06G043400 [Paspalum vaginatum]
MWCTLEASACILLLSCDIQHSMFYWILYEFLYMPLISCVSVTLSAISALGNMLWKFGAFSIASNIQVEKSR